MDACAAEFRAAFMRLARRRKRSGA